MFDSKQMAVDTLDRIQDTRISGMGPIIMQEQGENICLFGLRKTESGGEIGREGADMTVPKGRGRSERKES